MHLTQSARVAVLGGGSEGHARRSGGGLQYTKRIHFHIQKNAGDHTDLVLWNSCQTVDAPRCTLTCILFKI